MDSLSETIWDVVICGTGLQESLLALSLSRSEKKVLHIDPNGYYGGPDASLSLPEADQWAEQHAPAGPDATFRSASVSKSTALSSPRAYSLALSPQVIHARSSLLSQLVSSRAYRQVEFLAVGSFFVYRPPSQSSEAPSLVRIPSTREDVFTATAISARSKRSLMKFLKFVLDFESAEQNEMWEPFAEMPLSDFLRTQFNLDPELQRYVHALTLSLRETIPTKEGLGIVHRHLTSMGVFGPGFAAVYPKWGGISEIAQVACRAGAVGGAIYMLGTKMSSVDEEGAELLGLELSNESGEGNVRVKTRLLVKGSQHAGADGDDGWTGRLVAVIDSPLTSLFQAVVEGAPTPAVAVVALSSTPTNITDSRQLPTYVFAHSSETGECPAGQSVLYLTTRTEHGSEQTKARLEAALDSFLEATGETRRPESLYRLYYEHRDGLNTIPSTSLGGRALTLSGCPTSLAFDDSKLEPVHEIWKRVMGPEAENPEAEYLKFLDREGAEEYDDFE